MSDGTVATTTAMSLFMMPAGEIDEEEATVTDASKAGGSGGGGGRGGTIYEQDSDGGSSGKAQAICSCLWSIGQV